MESYTLADWEVDAMDYFREDIEKEREPSNGEFTADSIQEITGLSKSRITRRMADAVKAGKATVRIWLNSSGHDIKVYKWVDVSVTS